MVLTFMHKIGSRTDNISFEISHFYFPVSQIRYNLFELFQIGAKKSQNLGSFSDRLRSVSDRHYQICVSRSVHCVADIAYF